jgi:hypothetical protein
VLLYAAQAALLGALAWILVVPHCRRRLVPTAAVVLWVVGVTAIFRRYGADGLLDFYSNDQRYHQFLVGKLEWGGRPMFFSDIEERRYTFLGWAWLGRAAGFDEVLVLKFVALVCSLVTYRLVERELDASGAGSTLRWVWLTTGPVMLFFSLLALRETMLAMSLTYLFVGRNPSLRLAAFVNAFILRPHLGVALAAGWGLVWAVRRIPAAWHSVRLAVTAVSSALLGAWLLAVIGRVVGSWTPSVSPFPPNKDAVFGILANLTGLQFLLVDTVTIERSLTNLIVTRALFFETIAVPTLFALSLFVPFARFERLRLWVFASFVIYLGVITGTDFTSFRQTLPFMPTMGLLVVHGWLELREGRRPRHSLRSINRSATPVG